MTKIDFLDLNAQIPQIRDEIKSKFEDIIDNTAFVLGKYVKDFEEKFADLHQVKHCIAVNSGTSALHVALVALNIGPRHEVIVPVNTFIATAEAVSLTGATPVFVDVNERSFNIDPEKIKSAITDKTRAIIPVHLYGQPANLDPILNIANKHDLFVIEDAAQAHLAEYKGMRVGGFGNIGCFSFYPSKNLGAWGEGGAIVTNDKEIARKVKMLRDHGSEKKYHHEFIGHNYRMSAFQGAVLSTKLKYLGEWTEKRRQNADQYSQLLEGLSQVKLPQEMEYAKHVYYVFVVRCERRDALQNHLTKKEIYTGLHYPIPLHIQKAYQHLGYNEGDFPVAEKLAREILSLPFYPEIEKEQMSYVRDAILEFYKK